MGEKEPLEAPFRLAEPARPRTKRSGWRCAAVTCGIIAAIVVCVIVFSIYKGLTLMMDTAKNPHKELLHNGTETAGNKVVKPLIDLDATYDVAVTVWVRQPDDLEAIDAERERYREEHGNETVTADQTIASMLGMPLREIQLEPVMDVVYAGIVARDLSLKSGPQDVKIEFDLPLARFYDDPMFIGDARMGVGLIPSSASKLFRMEGWSDWHQSVPRRDDLADNLLSGFSAEGVKNTTDLIAAIQAFSVSQPIIEFHAVHDPCPPKNGTDDTLAKEEEDDDDLYASIRKEEETEDEADESKSYTNRGKVDNRMAAFVVSRSHFYVVNETRLFERKAYDKRHKSLVETSCGQNYRGLHPHRRLCSRGYNAHGHWETRFVVQSEEAGGKNELAYGPYLAHLRHAIGPKDLHRLPVTRGNCSGVERDRSSDPNTMRVNHTMRFSSLTPGRVRLLEDFQQSQRPSLNATKAEIVADHDQWEQMAGLLGDRGEGTHPWTRLVLGFLETTLIELPTALLTLAYWHTRATTAGINVFATRLYAVSLVAFNVAATIFSLHELDEWLSRLLAVIFNAWTILPCSLMLKAVWPLEFVPASWSVRRTIWTHRERQSQRVEKQIGWLIRFAVIAGCFAISWVPRYFKHYVVRPVHVPHVKTTQHWFFKSNFILSLFLSPHQASQILQLEHNRRAGTFTGNFAITAYLLLADKLFDIIYHFPSIVGRFDTLGGWEISDIIWIVVSAAGVYQAATLPRVEQHVEDSEDE